MSRALRITARMCIAAPMERLGLRGAAARRSATWPLGPFGLGATSHTRPRYVQSRKEFTGHRRHFYLLRSRRITLQRGYFFVDKWKIT